MHLQFLQTSNRFRAFSWLLFSSTFRTKLKNRTILKATIRTNSLRIKFSSAFRAKFSSIRNKRLTHIALILTINIFQHNHSYSISFSITLFHVFHHGYSRGFLRRRQSCDEMLMYKGILREAPFAGILPTKCSKHSNNK